MRIYLATPYSHPDPEVREARFQLVNAVAARLMREGHHVYSPISHTHPIALAGDLPKGWDFWEAYDRTFIDWAEEVHILLAEGWQESKGVQAEMKIATDTAKPVRFIAPSSTGGKV